MRLTTLLDKILDENAVRWGKLKRKYLVHATTEDNIESIKEEGLLPRELSGCFVWSEDRVPLGIDEPERILECRENHVYFWDDVFEGLSQSIATVGYMIEGNPAIVIADVEGLEDKLEYDPEVHRYGEPEEDEPISYMYPGKIDPERIKCVCTLSKEYKPDMGKVACPLMHDTGCPDYSPERLYEEYTDPDKWECECRW